jgi:hypothetical protein
MLLLFLFQYNFVTPLTSMVVIKPDDPNTDASNLDDSPMSGDDIYAKSAGAGVSGYPHASISLLLLSAVLSMTNYAE